MKREKINISLYRLIKKCILSVMLCLLGICSTRLLANESVGYIKFICDEKVNLSNIKIMVNTVNKSNEFFGENSFVEYSNDAKKEIIYTDKNGEAMLVLPDGEYSLYIDENSLPSNTICNELYYEYNANEDLLIELIYTNTDYSNAAYSLQNTSVLNSVSSLDMDFDELIEEFSGENIVQQNGFTIFSYSNNQEIDTDTISNLIDDLIDIRTYFCIDNEFPTPKTREKNNSETIAPFYIFLIDLNNADGLTRFVSIESNFSYICIDPSVITDNKFKIVASHEYFHAIQNSYRDPDNIGYGINSSFLEGTATMASFIYVSQCEMNMLEENKFIYYIEFFSNKYFLSSDESLFSTNNSRHYGTFIFHLFVYQEYGGYNVIKSFLSECFNTTTDLNNYEELNLYIEKIKSSCGFAEYNIDDLYNEYLIYFTFPSENFDLNGYEQYMNNSKSETLRLPFNDCYESGQIDETEIFIESGGIFVYRIDARDYSYMEHRFVFSSEEMLSYIQSNLRVKVYSKNLNGVWTDRNYNNENLQETNRIDFSLGNGTNQSYIIIIYNLGEYDMQISYHYLNNYYVIGECLYGIEVKEGYIKRYMAYELDEYNCISDNCNVFLKTNELSNSHRYDSSVKFWIRKVNNYYEIEPYALPYEDSTCEEFLVTSTNDNNISLKCNDYATLNRKWLLTDELTNTNFIRLYTIKSYANSTMCISISNFNNGSNNGNQISSTGNVILKSSSQNTQWKFIAVSDE